MLVTGVTGDMFRAHRLLSRPTMKRVFYAWQSDRKSSVCRRFIREALDQAARELERAADVHDSSRPVELIVDSDTRGVPGSPPIADTIIERINDCDVFVADLAPMAAPGPRPTPNPNVLLEYGYALRALGGHRIVAVMNDFYGDTENLPFDIRHRRWPIRYTLDPDADRKERSKVRAQLKQHLRAALAPVLGAQSEAGDAASASHENVERRDLWGTPSLVQRPDGSRVEILHGPSMTLEIAPTHEPQTKLSNAAMKAVAGRLTPCDENSSGIYGGRIFGGAVRFTADPPPTTIRAACAVTEDSRLHGVNYSTLRPRAGGRHMPIETVENMLCETLHSFLDVAERFLGLMPPLHAWVSLVGVSDYKLDVDPAKFGQPTVGLIMKGMIGREFRIESFDDDPGDLLRPFFEDIYDEAGGYKRPTSG